MIEDAARLLLLVDEEPAQARLVAAIAARAGWRLLRAADVGQALDVLAQQPVGAAIVDHWGSEGEGAAIVARLHAAAPAVPILMLTARSSVGLAVAAMRAGAADFLAKPISPDRLLAALDLVAKPAAPGELRPLTEKLATPLAFDEIVGSAPAFRAAMAIAAKAARARVSVLAEGESGVGKEVIAHAIHAASPRARKPMVVVGCGAIPSKLADSELFGHERGAFTGAFERTLGRFVEADGGTLLLDDVGELPMETQARLLRVLQSGEVQPLGGRATRSVDVRIIATSSRPLLEQIAAGKFREDLYYRLAVVQLTIPPLRTRSGDIPALVRHLLARIAEHPGIRPLGITEGALALLMRYEWPGNVRQLQNALFRAAILCEGDALTEADFPQIAEEASVPLRVAGPPAGGGGIMLYDPSGHLRSLEAIEADVIRLAIGHYRGRMTEVARRLGIGRSTLYRKLSELGIDNAA